MEKCHETDLSLITFPPDLCNLHGRYFRIVRFVSTWLPVVLNNGKWTIDGENWELITAIRWSWSNFSNVAPDHSYSIIFHFFSLFSFYSHSSFNFSLFQSVYKLTNKSLSLFLCVNFYVSLSSLECDVFENVPHESIHVVSISWLIVTWR